MSQLATADDLAAIGDAIGRGPGLTTDRAPIGGWLAPLAALASDAAPAEIDAALTQIRELLPVDLDRQTRATLRAEIRARHPTIAADMIDAALAPAPRTTAPADNDRRPSQATRVVDLALAAGAEVWHSPAGDPHITIPRDGHAEHYRLRAREVRDWLARRHHGATRSAPGSQAIADALAVLAGMARYDGPAHAPAVRVGAHAGAVYLDLGDPTWRAVEIAAAGWRIVDRPPVRMLRSRGMLSLPMPRRGESIDALRDVLHVATDDDHHLIIGWLLGALRPTGPYPLLALVGEQGAGKSTAARLVRRLIDPHVAELRAEPRDVTEIMIAATRSRVVALDNLSHLPPWLSDALCRLATGGALTRRELYTDDDEIIIEAMRPAIVTAITDVVTRGDLLDRAIVITLPAIEPSARMPEAELWARYDIVAPAVLGALLDAVVAALAGEGDVHLAELPRMADWARWCTAAEPAIGWPAGAIVGAYRAMAGSAVEATIDGDPLGSAIRGLDLPWSGTAAELLARLAPTGRAPRGWPESPRALAAALRRLAPGLRRLSIEIGYRRSGHERTRIIVIEYRAGASPDHGRQAPDAPSAPSAPSIASVSAGDPADGRADGREDVCVRAADADGTDSQPGFASAFASAFPSAGSPAKTLTGPHIPADADDADDGSPHLRHDPWAHLPRPPGSAEAAAKAARQRR